MKKIINTPAGAMVDGYYKIQRLQPKHKEILRLVALGMKDTAIAERVGVTPANVRAIKNSPVALRTLSILQVARDAQAVDIRTDIDSFAGEAMSVVKQGIAGELGLRESERVKAAFKMLDMAGFGPVQRSQHQHTVGVITPDVLEKISARSQIYEAALSDEEAENEGAPEEVEYESA